MPKKGCAAILNASAANGASSVTGQSTNVSSWCGRWPWIAGTSIGAGRKSITASSSACTPLFLNEAPQSTGTNSIAIVALRIAWRISATVSSSPARYFSISSSSCSTAASTALWRAASTASRRSAGTSVTVNVLPSVDSSKMYCLRSMTSMWPVKSSPEPTGSCSGNARRDSRSWIIARQRSKLAPVRSILLAKIIRGTRYRSAWRHTVSVCGSTPATESRRATAPSSTRSERSTSTVKSTWPGVSMMLMRYSGPSPFVSLWPWRCQKHVVAADVIVMPRSCSCSIQSIVAAPSCTSPILCDLPV